MGDSETRSDLDIKGLNLIEVSSEDDCLFHSPLADSINPPSSEKGSETKTVKFGMDPKNLEESIELEQPPDSSEQDKTRKSGKYNLRKSLAWDSAFFTNAGFLEPEDLTSMLGGNEKADIYTLPGIQEDVNRSYDSLTTLDGENLTMESLEDDLFEDIRASIQKSNRVSNTTNPSCQKELKTTDSRTVLCFLKPVELSSMLGGNEKADIHTLPGIQEDVHNSYDSLTTLESETLTMESLEVDLFEDVRASIQKSNKVSNNTNPSGQKELKTTDSRTVPPSIELTAQDKVKQKTTLKKPNVGVKDSGKILKQPVVRSGESTSSFHKPPKVLSKVGPISTTSTKRLSLGAKNIRMEKNAKSGTGKGTIVSKTPALGVPRSIVPRPKLPSKSSSCSPASSITDIRSSCSSLESCASVSSERINKSSLNLIKHKNDSRKANASSSSQSISTPSKMALKGKNQAGSSKLLTLLKSSTKLSSSISPSSSISEWSSESSSSISAAIQMSNVVRASLSTGSCKGPTADAHQVMDSQNYPIGRCSLGDGAENTASLDKTLNKVLPGTGGLLHPASMKPSGLRMPSPKIGFFDGVRSSGHTPNGTMLSNPGVLSGLPKIGANSTSPSGSSNKTKSGKLQTARTLTAIQSPKVDLKQTSLSAKSRSSLHIQNSPNAATKASSALRNRKSSPGISPKLQNKSSPRTGRESCSKAQGIEGGKDVAPIKDTKIVPIGVPEIADDFGCKSDVQNTIVDSQLANGHKEPDNSLSKSNHISLTSDLTSGSRIPLSVKDSFYNMDAPNEDLPGSAVAVEKTTILPLTESTIPEHS